MRSFAVLALFVCISFTAFPARLLADGDSRCDSAAFSASGYYFDSFESTEYVGGLLRVHLRLQTSYNDGRMFYASVVPLNVLCWIVGPDAPPVLFTPGVARYSFRMTSSTHWVLWDDEHDVPFSCTNCSGDIPARTAYVSFVGHIDSAINQVFTTPLPPTSLQPCCDSVLFLPGITGSRLYRPGTLSLSDRKLWEPFRNADADELSLDQDGSSVNPDVYVKAGDVVDQAYAPFGPEIYGSLIDELNRLKGSQTIADFEAVPYDWRLSFDDILAKGAETDGRISYTTATDTPYITQELRRLAAGSKTGKVTIVAHSMGGLVAKELLRRLGDADAQRYVSRLVMVGTPQVGTPSAIASMLHGYGQAIAGGFILDEAHARTFAAHAPSAYVLLPSAAYLAAVSGAVVSFPDPSVAFAPESDLFGKFISSIEDLFAFLTNHEGRAVPDPNDTESAAVLDSGLLARSSLLHARIDAWRPPPGIELDQIAGSGEDTAGGIEYYFGSRKDCFPGVGTTVDMNGSDRCVGPEVRPVLTTEGDGLVMAPSALFLGSSDNVRDYRIDLASYNRQTKQNKGHADLFEIPAVEGIISSFLQKKPVQDSPYIAEGQPPSSSGMHVRLRLHSPLTMDAYDPEGDHTGISSSMAPGSDIRHIDAGIPNSYYFEFGDTKYLGVGSGEETTIMLSGYATSTFDLDVDQLEGDTVVASTSFSGVPVTPDTKATFTIGEDVSSASHLDVDSDGDGSVNISLAPLVGQAVMYAPPPDTIPVPQEPVFSSSGGLSAPQVVLTAETASSTGSVITTMATTTATTSPSSVSSFETIASTTVSAQAAPPIQRSLGPKRPAIVPITQIASVQGSIRPSWYGAIARWFAGLFARIGL